MLGKNYENYKCVMQAKGQDQAGGELSMEGVGLCRPAIFTQTITPPVHV